MKGRPRKPTAILKLTGNPGRRPLNDAEPTPRAAAPLCPDHLDDEARAEWARMEADLLALGLLTTIDRAALAGYCLAWSRWVKAERQITKYGEILTAKTNGILYQSPYLSIANRALKQMKEFLIEFGMTPAARTRVKVEQSNKPTGIKARTRA